MAAKSKWLWVGEVPIPPNVQEATREIGDLIPYRSDAPLSQQLRETAVAVVHPDGGVKDPHWMGTLLAELEHNIAVAVFLLPPEAHIARQMLARHQGQFLCVPDDAAPEQIAAQFTAAAAIQPVIGKLHAELADARILSAKAAHTIEEMDEEMRLAARLQRDFLPRRLPEVGPVKFGVLYRPAGWVSGDIYDVVRLDETNVGFYVADVVGHGMPAALLTMFIKKALQTKRIVGHTYEIVPPHVSLQELNIDICEQNLPSCQFCTAVYCVVDAADLTLTYARGGHPEPIVMHSNGEIERLWVEGSLLGIYAGDDYSSARYQLRAGDRLLLYTDGAEDELRRQPTGEMLPIEKSLARWASLTREEMLLQLTAGIDSRLESTSPKDDITVLVMDVEG